MAVPKVLILYKDNDQIVQLTGLRNAKTLAYLNTATVTLSLKDSKGATVFADTPLDYEAGSNGNYSATIQESFDPTAGNRYLSIIDAVQGGATLHLEVWTKVAVRRE
jgi:hypothetical protein